MTTRHSARRVARPRVRYGEGDFVLYRDPEAFWAGKPGGTFVCRVGRRSAGDRYDLVELSTGRRISRVEDTYLRLLPADEVMHEIDVAPLNEPDPMAMPSAAVSWLRQQLAAEGGGNPPAQP